MSEAKKPTFPKARNFSKQKITSAQLPGPTLTHLNTNFSPLRNDPILRESIFASSMTSTTVSEEDWISTNLSAFAVLIDETYAKINVKDSKICDQLTSELYRYYCISLLWARIINLKLAQKQHITRHEVDYIYEFTGKEFNIPGPILSYFKAMGLATDMGSKEFRILYPDLPTARAGEVGGFHAEVLDAENHNLFEEIPCLGMAADAFMRTLGRNIQREYRPPPMVGFHEELRPNRNFLGYGLLSILKPRTINVFSSMNISDTEFPETVFDTGLNVDLVRKASDYLAEQSTYSCVKGNIEEIREKGSPAQLIRTIPSGDSQITRNLTTRLYHSECTEQFSSVDVGLAIAYGFQAYKEPATGHDNNSLAHRTWSCIDFIDGHVHTEIPIEWIVNRNDFRDLPDWIQHPVFRSADLAPTTIRGLAVSSTGKALIAREPG